MSSLSAADGAIEAPALSGFARLRRVRKGLELATVIVLSIGGVASTYCSFQSALWNSIEASSYARAGKLRVESTRASTLGGQQSAIDVSTFVAWLQAYAGGQLVLASFLEHRFRSEFRPAFDEWRASTTLQSSAASTPFALPSYRVAANVRAEVLGTEADAAAARGERANRLSDLFVADALLFALSLFVAGVSPQFKRPRLRVVVVTLSGVVLLAALGFLATLSKTTL